jgi:hypothetical protein
MSIVAAILWRMSEKNLEFGSNRLIFGHSLRDSAKRRDLVIECLSGEDGWRVEKTPVINDAIGEQRLAKHGLRLMGRTRSTRVVSFEGWLS